MIKQELHVVFGAGQVGPLVAQRLVALGHRVRVARKTAAPSPAAGVENVSLDVRDADAVARATEGAAVVYHCANPVYTAWSEMLLPMTRGIVDGAARSGARLVVLDNLYMYGDTHHMTEETPVAPVSKKGALRAQAAEYMLAADAGGKARVAIGRAADFFGPGTPQSMFGDSFWPRVQAGKTAQLFGNPDELHSYSYTPDVAAGLVRLGQDPGARGVWMLPVQPAESTRAVVARFARCLGHDVPITKVPTWALRALGLFQPMLRELAEMTYQWQHPYVVDDTRFRAAYGFGATGWDEAVAETVRWGLARYGGERNVPPSRSSAHAA
jgi:nucleoside-diphosphate-sugar epimerase